MTRIFGAVLPASVALDPLGKRLIPALVSESTEDSIYLVTEFSNGVILFSLTIPRLRFPA